MSRLIKKHLLLLFYRGGSTLFTHMIMCPPKKDGICLFPKETNIKSFARTINKQSAVVITEPLFVLPYQQMIKDLENKYDGSVWINFFGDWWGQTSAKDVCEPYGIDTPASWSYKYIEEFINDGWKISVLVREGKSWIESTRRFIPSDWEVCEGWNMTAAPKGELGLEERRSKEDPVDYFEFLCKGYRNRVRVIVDANKRFPDKYKIFKFEDLTRDPKSVLEEFNDHSELGLDIKECLLAKEDLDSRGKQHSSFKSKIKSYNWTKEEINLFSSIAGKEESELGYSL